MPFLAAIASAIFLGGLVAIDVVAAYRVEAVAFHAGHFATHAFQPPEAMQNCTAGGFADMLRLQNFTAISKLASACDDGHGMAVQVLLAGGLKCRDSVAQLKSIVALRELIDHLDDRHIELATSCARALLGALESDDQFISTNAVAAVGEIAARFSDMSPPLALNCLATMAEFAFLRGRLDARLQAIYVLGAVALKTRESISDAASLSISLLQRWGLSANATISVRLRMAEALSKVAIGAKRAKGGALTAQSIDALIEGALDDERIHGYTVGLLGTVASSMRGEHAHFAARCITALSEKAIGDDEGDSARRSYDSTGLVVIGSVAVRSAREPQSGVFAQCLGVLAEKGVGCDSRGVAIRAIDVLAKLAEAIAPVNGTLALCVLHVLRKAERHSDFVVRNTYDTVMERLGTEPRNVMVRGGRRRHT